MEPASHVLETLNPNKPFLTANRGLETELKPTLSLLSCILRYFFVSHEKLTHLFPPSWS